MKSGDLMTAASSLTVLILVALAPSSAHATCSAFRNVTGCLAAPGCAWCNESYTPSTSGVCYDTKTEHCCSAYNDCQQGPFQNSACLKNQTCCTPLREGRPICCASGMGCCQGYCYDPQVHICCPESYPEDLCGNPALCALSDTCCPAYYSMCCSKGSYCCSDYHGNSGCFPNEYPVQCDGDGCQKACPAGSVCYGCPKGCKFPNGTCVAGYG